ncbi:MAG: rod shape-determining protein MreC [Allosphingosinicella sp.]
MGLFLSYVIAVGGTLFAGLLLVIAIVDPTGFNALKGVALDVTSPVSSGGRWVARQIGGAFDSVGNYFQAGGQNAELRRRLQEARRGLIKAQATELENKRLKALLKLTSETRDEVITTRIVGSSFASVRRLATLSAGASSGVLPGQPVRSADGLVGRVIESGRWASRVLLVADSASNVPVRLVRDGTAAIATGHGDGTIDLKTLEVGENPFRRGDVLVTSGVGGVYPPDIPVAVVVKVEGDRTVAKPLADPSNVEYAMVLPVYQPLADTPLTETTEGALRGAGQ